MYEHFTIVHHESKSNALKQSTSAVKLMKHEASEEARN